MTKPAELQPLNIALPPAPRRERRLLGIVLMLSAALFMTATDAAGKWALQVYPLAQMNLLRGLFAILIIAPLLWRIEGAAGYRTTRPWPHVGRGVLLIVIAFSWFFALQYMQLADATALAMCAPLFMIALSVPLLGETVGWRRLSAVGVGFCGMLLIVRPGSAVFQPVSVVPVGAAFGYALYMVTNRVLSVTETMTALTLYPQLAIVLGSAVAAPFVWVTPTWEGFAVMAGTGLLAGIGHLMLTVAFRYAPASVIAPLDYTALVWAIAYGYFLFGTLPDAFAVMGMVLIVGAGLFVIWREAVAKQAAGPAQIS